MTTSLYQVPRASFVMFKGDKLKSKGKGEEEVYFSQQERNVLKKLLAKMEHEAKAERKKTEYSSDSDDDSPAEKRRHKRTEADDKLEEIFESHGVKDREELMEALLDWKEEKEK